MTLLLPSPDIAMVADIASTRLVLPQLTEQTPTISTAVAIDHYDGDTDPTVWRSRRRSTDWQLAVTLTPAEQPLAVALMDLFETAALTVGDGRLLLRQAGASVPGLSTIQAVTVDSWTPTPLAGGGVQVSFHAIRCAWTDEV